MIGRSAAHLAIAAVLALLPGCGSCEDPIPPDESFDGNVIIGDASPPPDADPVDAADAAEEDEAGIDDAGDGGGGDAEAGTDAAPGDAVPADSGIDCAPQAFRAISATTAIAEADLLQDQFVEITGTATVAALACTGCADSGSCTCTCTATAAIDGLVALARSECFGSPGCSGNECTQVCRPPILGVEQRFLGRLNVRNSGPEKSVALELYSVSP